jgi:hypothetical protein
VFNGFHVFKNAIVNVSKTVVLAQRAFHGRDSCQHRILDAAALELLKYQTTLTRDPKNIYSTVLAEKIIRLSLILSDFTLICQKFFYFNHPPNNLKRTTMGIIDDYYGGYENIAMHTNEEGETDFEAAYNSANGLDDYDEQYEQEPAEEEEEEEEVEADVQEEDTNDQNDDE